MNHRLFISVLIIVILTFWFCKPKTKKGNGVISEWKQKVNSAKLTKELFNSAKSIEEKENLIYYFTQKIRQKDNYGDASLAKMPKILKTVYLVNEYESEVNNGGFHQFFTNPSGKYTNETIESLQLIGAEKSKELLEEALAILLKHNETHKNLNKKLNNLKLYEIVSVNQIEENDNLINELDELNEAFFKSKEPTHKLKIEYFEKNSDKIWDELREKYGH